jgi:hypothetical protein
VELLEKLTMSQYGEKLVQAFHNFLDVNKPDIRQPIHVLYTQMVNRSELFIDFNNQSRLLLIICNSKQIAIFDHTTSFCRVSMTLLPGPFSVFCEI